MASPRMRSVPLRHAVRMLVACGVLTAVVLPRDIVAQPFEQVYPRDGVGPLRAVTYWSADTLFAAGPNDQLLRSIDGGVSWSSLRTGQRDWHYLRMAKTSRGIVLLAEASQSHAAALPRRQRSVLLRIEPRTGALVELPAPPLVLPDTLPDWVVVDEYDLAATNDALYFLQGSRRYGIDFKQLVRSVDGGDTWSVIPLPDSLEFSRRYIFSYNSTRVGLIAGRIGSGVSMSMCLTSDGGTNWSWVHGFAVYDNQGDWDQQGAPAHWIDSSTIVTFDDGLSARWTSDGGGTWESRGACPSMLAAFTCTSSSSAWLLGRTGEVHRTDDGFRSFVRVRSGRAYFRRPDSESGTAIVARADGRACAVDNLGNAFATLDGGTTWVDGRQAGALVNTGPLMVDSVRGFALLIDYNTNASG